jgi:hypothetical protein
MTQKGTTKDELFMLKLYELASKKGDPTEPVDRYLVGKALGHHDHAINILVRDLAQTNFIKKDDEDNTIYLTPNGISLVLQLKKERG